MTAERVVVVGASLAGASTAVALRRLGFEGELVLLGEEPHLPYERPPLSKGYLQGGVPVEQLHLHPAGTYTELDIDLRLGAAATGLDVARKVVQLADGTEQPYDACVIATGAVNLTPPLDGIRAGGVHQLRGLADADRLAADAAAADTAVVVGMGFIGCEVAATLRLLGLQVTLVDRLPGPLLAQLGPQLSQRVRRWHEEHGVELVAGAGVARLLQADGRVDAVQVEDGRRVPADLVVVGVGVRPATDWLTSAPVHLIAGAVGVDAAGRTNVQDVYAAGDVAAVWDAGTGLHRRTEHYRTALDQAERVAHAVMERPLPAAPPSWFWSEQYDHVLHYAGERDGTVLHERQQPYVGFFCRGATLTAVAAIDNGRDFRRALRLLGTDIDPALLTDPAVDLRSVPAAMPDLPRASGG